MQHSDKFTIIKILAAEKKFSKYIPEFINPSNGNISSFLAQTNCCILRSSITSEASKHNLLPGKSISIKHVESIEDFNDAYEIVSQQQNIIEIILQKQIKYEHHLTIYYEKDFFYINHKDGHTILTPKTIVGKIPQLNLLSQFLIKWSKRFPKSKMLLEMGLTDDSIYLFQAVGISDSLISTVLNDDLLHKIIQTRQNWKKNQNLIGLLKTEWDAYQFRRSPIISSISTAFENWRFLFHYFYLFCKMKHLHGTDHDFALFLGQATDSGWLGKLVKKHLKIADLIQKNETTQLPSSFISTENAPYFIGKGSREGVVDSNMALLENPTPEQIYQLPINQILVTCSNQILSHAIMAAAERGILVVANISLQLFNSIEKSDRFYLNFDQKTFVLKSKEQ